MAKKSPKTKAKLDVPKIDPYLEGLMGKLLDRLESIERKIEALAAPRNAAPNGQPNGRAPQQQQPSQQNRPPAQQNQPHRPPQQQPQQPRRDRTMYEAICADCQKVCEVPFQPTEGRAVYCKDCFAIRKGQGGRPSSAQPNGAPKIQSPAAPKPVPAAAVPAPPKAAAPAKPSKKAAKKGKKK